MFCSSQYMAAFFSIDLFFRSFVHYFTNNNNYLLDTSPLADLDSSYDSNSYQARLFAYDYTNIRGKTPTLVAESNSVSWRVTGL